MPTSSVAANPHIASCIPKANTPGPGLQKMFCNGRAGQTAYAYANSVCEMLCLSRRAAGLPAQAIGWGPVDNVGYVAENLKVTLSPVA